MDVTREKLIKPALFDLLPAPLATPELGPSSADFSKLLQPAPTPSVASRVEPRQDDAPTQVNTLSPKTSTSANPQQEPKTNQKEVHREPEKAQDANHADSPNEVKEKSKPAASKTESTHKTKEKQPENADAAANPTTPATVPVDPGKSVQGSKKKEAAEQQSKRSDASKSDTTVDSTTSKTVTVTPPQVTTQHASKAGEGTTKSTEGEAATTPAEAALSVGAVGDKAAGKGKKAAHVSTHGTEATTTEKSASEASVVAHAESIDAKRKVKEAKVEKKATDAADSTTKATNQETTATQIKATAEETKTTSSTASVQAPQLSVVAAEKPLEKTANKPKHEIAAEAVKPAAAAETLAAVAPTAPVVPSVDSLNNAPQNKPVDAVEHREASGTSSVSNTPRTNSSLLKATTDRTATNATSNGTTLDPARFLQRVARAFQVATQKEGEVRLRLHPPELGAIKVEIQVHDGTLTAKVQTETNDARSAILDNLPALRDRLAEQGIKIEKFDVDLFDHSGGQPQQPGEQSQDQTAKQLYPRANSRTDLTRRLDAPESPAGPTRVLDNQRINIIV